ncbi:MAG TPA: hypothetical protein VLC48_07630 [Gemmatimonadota bacterium]|nr:hypothetical protein [Gemmatimonadota bacterium]
MTLLDLLIGLTITGVVMTAAVSVMVRHRRLFTNIEYVAMAVGRLSHLEAAFGAELLPINPSAGDLIYAGPDSLVARSFVGVYSVCDMTLSTVSFTVRRISRGDALIGADSALVYSQGPSAEVTDDLWEPFQLDSVSTANCPDGEAGWTFRVQGLTATEAAAVPPGAPLRAFTRTSYSFVERDDGWYIVRKGNSRPGYSIGGPFMRPGNDATGLRFRYLDATGNVTDVESEVARVDVAATAVQSVSEARGDPVPVSRTLSFTFRNN